MKTIDNAVVISFKARFLQNGDSEVTKSQPNRRWQRRLKSFLKKFYIESLENNPGGALECNLTGGCSFFISLHNPFRKKFCISIPCFGIFRLQNNRKTIGKTIAYCS